MTLTDFNSITEDNSKMVLKEIRVETINEVAEKMIEFFNSNVEMLIKRANYDAITLQELILSKFNSFSDTAIYNGKTVYFNKRAQLLTADLNYILELNGQQSLTNIDKITACADYKIPFILREFGILEYNEHLSAIVDNKIVIEKGSKEEIEIRAFAIWAVELMKKEYKKQSVFLRSNQINDFLWLISQIKSPRYKPYHLTLTNSY